MSMFQCSIRVDLPSELSPVSSRVASLMRQFFLGLDSKASRKHITQNGLVVLENTLTACMSAGFDDVISILVEKKPIYVDTQQRIGDLQWAMDRMLASDALKDGLRDVSIILSQQRDGLHTLANIEVNDEVLSPDSAVNIKWSTRCTQFRVQKGENPIEYQCRIAAALDSGLFDRQVLQNQYQAKSFVDCLQGQLHPENIVQAPLTVRVVIPGETQMGRFRHLYFGTFVRERSYSASRKRTHLGAYDDPHVYYYYDPYHDLLSWIMVQEALAHRWSAEGINFVHPNGQLLAIGGEALSKIKFDTSMDAISLTDRGVTVSDEIPHVGFHPSEAGSPHSPGWGGGH